MSYTETSYPKLPSNSELLTSSVGIEISEKGYVAEAPRLEELVADSTRTNEFRYFKTDGYLSTASDNYDKQSGVKRTTEQAGLIELQSYLTDVILRSQGSTNPENQRLEEVAKDILENLTFIGNEELDESVKGLGEYWKDFLANNPDSELCVLFSAVDENGKKKSSSYIFEKIMSTFSEEELKVFGFRIKTDLNEVKNQPDKTKVIILDDWTLSGSQINYRLSGLLEDPSTAIFSDSLEINLIAAAGQLIENGFPLTQIVEGYNVQSSKTIPVRAYFRAHDARIGGITSFTNVPNHITGLHSSTDRGFGQELAEMRSQHLTELPLPALANTVRPYRSEKFKGLVMAGVIREALGKRMGNRKPVESTQISDISEADIEDLFNTR